MARRGMAAIGAATLVAGAALVGAGASAASSDEAASSARAVRSWPNRPTASLAQVQQQASAGARASAAGRTVVFVTKELRDFGVDLDPAGDSPGDFFFFEERVFDSTGRNVVGKDSVRCEAGIRTFSCEATLLVTGKGKILVEGALFSETDNVLPVTGGSGVYQGVGGQLSFFNLAGGRTALVLHLTR